ncbi:MAG TPA: hypothetical protein VLB80_05190 [Candidatus Babeliales bacterium]|nr:hypothetical protein [Candidatus Babeliales bacterium]
MSDIRKIQQKRSFFFIVITTITFNWQCYGMYTAGLTLAEKLAAANLSAAGTSSDPLYLVIKHTRKNTAPDTASTETLSSRLFWTLLQIALSVGVPYIFNKLTEDPEVINLTKQERQIELELKNHPNYVEVTLLQEQSKAASRLNDNEERRQQLVLQDLQRRLHVEQKINEYRECAKTGTTPTERDGCQQIYESYLNNYNIYFSSK